MKAYELLKINTNLLEMMSKFDIKRDDCKFLKLYEEYHAMKEKGEKYWYIITKLAERYGVSASSVKRLVKRLSREVIF